jgi:hypothetical protein
LIPLATAILLRFLEADVDCLDAVLLLEVVFVLGKLLLQNVVDLTDAEVLQLIVPDSSRRKLTHLAPGRFVVVINDSIDNNVTGHVGHQRVNLEYVLHPLDMLQSHVEHFVEKQAVEFRLLEILSELRIDHDRVPIRRCGRKIIDLSKGGIEKKNTKERAVLKEPDPALDDLIPKFGVRDVHG